RLRVVRWRRPTAGTPTRCHIRGRIQTGKSDRTWAMPLHSGGGRRRSDRWGLRNPIVQLWQVFSYSTEGDVRLASKCRRSNRPAKVERRSLILGSKRCRNAILAVSEG